MRPIDPAKVQARVNELNHQFGPDWWAIGGLYALTTMTIENSRAEFNPANGMPLKIFTNQTTGEIKIYDARIFTR